MTKLYVANLPYTITEDQLKQLFKPFGEIETISIVTNQAGKPKGFAFVEMQTEEAAQQASKTLHQTQFGKRKLTVSISYSKT